MTETEYEVCPKCKGRLEYDHEESYTDDGDCSFWQWYNCKDCGEHFDYDEIQHGEDD